MMGFVSLGLSLVCIGCLLWSRELVARAHTTRLRDRAAAYRRAAAWAYAGAIVAAGAVVVAVMELTS